MWVPRTRRLPISIAYWSPKGPREGPRSPLQPECREVGSHRWHLLPHSHRQRTGSWQPPTLPHQAPAFLCPALPQSGSLTSVIWCHPLPLSDSLCSLKVTIPVSLSRSQSLSALSLSQGVPLPLGLLFLTSTCLSLCLIMSPPVSLTPSLNLGPYPCLCLFTTLLLFLSLCLSLLSVSALCVSASVCTFVTVPLCLSPTFFLSPRLCYSLPASLPISWSRPLSEFLCVCVSQSLALQRAMPPPQSPQPWPSSKPCF